MSLVAAVPLVIVAAGAAFCCTCFPIGFVGFGVGYQGEAAPLTTQGEVLMWAAWVFGGVVGAVAGFAMWSAARRPVDRESEQL